AVEPLVAARGALCASRHGAPHLYHVSERTRDRASLGRERDHPGLARPLVGARVAARLRRAAARPRERYRCPRAAGGPTRMMLLRGYLIRAVVRGVLTALAVLVGVTVSIELVGQLEDVGDGNYTLPMALAYVALRIPRTVFSTLPAAALIGSLLSLGNLAVHRELTVMRASGISPWQLLVSVGLAGFGLAVFMALLGESIAPSLGAYASSMRSRAVNADIDMADGQSIWFKEGDLILNLSREANETAYSGVLAFELGE